MDAGRLTFGHGFDPRRGERCFLDSETRIDQHEPLVQKFREMLRVAIGAGRTDPDALRDVVDAHEHKIETARTDAAHFEIAHQLSADRLGNAFEVFRIADRLHEFEHRARHLRRHEGRQDFGDAPSAWSRRSNTSDPKRVCNDARGLLASCAMRSMPTSRKLSMSCSPSRSAATGRLPIASDARPAGTISAFPYRATAQAQPGVSAMAALARYLRSYRAVRAGL